MRKQQPYNPQRPLQVCFDNISSSSQDSKFLGMSMMSQPIDTPSDTQMIDSRRMSQLQNSIMYLAKYHPLKDVMKLMEELHGYKATKAQYEKHYDDCGIRKNHSGQDWKIINRKLKTRKRKGRESDVYLDGQLVEQKKVRKEVSRYPTTFMEDMQQASAPSPKTPPGFAIQTPAGQPLFRLMFMNLPILKFQDPQFLGQLSETVNDVDDRGSLAGQLLRQFSDHSDNSAILPLFESLLPNSSLLEEASASELALNSPEDLSATVFLNLLLYLTSNNFPGKSNSQMIYALLKQRGGPRVLDTLLARNGSTADAIVEKLFRSAVEAGDMPVIRHLLHAGLDPNGHVCTLKEIPDNLTPMQLACITRNTAMAQELVRAGSRTDEPGSGWKSSALVLAISGRYYLGEEQSHIKDWTGDERETSDNYQSSADNLQDLITVLLNAGSSVNPSGRLHTPGSAQGLPSRIRSLFQDGHSPLTAASKFRQNDIVTFLLQKGADVSYTTQNGTSALQECMYSWEQMRLDVSAKPFLSRNPIFSGCFELSSVVSVAKSLLDAKANPNHCTIYRHNPASNNIYDNDDGNDLRSPKLSSLDLAILSGSLDLVESLLLAGVTATQQSLTFAIEFQDSGIFKLLLSTGIQATKEFVQYSLRKFEAEYSEALVVDLLLQREQDFETRKLALITAIKHGKPLMLEIVIAFECSNTACIFESSPALMKAIEACCSLRVTPALRVLEQVLNDENFSGSFAFASLGCSIYAALKSRCDAAAKLDLLLLAGADVNATSAELGFETPLFAAVRYGDERFVDKLVTSGADVNAKSAAQKTALLVAIENRNDGLVHKLLESGATTNVMIECSKCLFDLHTPSGNVLVEAVAWGDMTIVRSLIKSGAKLNEPGRESSNSGGNEQCVLPLTAAIRNGHWNVVEYLLSRGADADNPLEIFTSETPLSAAIFMRKEDLTRQLLFLGANSLHPLVLKAAVDQDDLSLLQQLLEGLRGRDPVPQGTNFGHFALLAAIKKGHPGMVEDILQSNIVDINKHPHQLSNLHVGLDRKPHNSEDRCLGVFARDSLDSVQSPLQLAVELGNIDITKLFLNHGANPDASTDPEYTIQSLAPIQTATQARNLDMMRVLLQHKANPDATSKKVPDTPLQFAAENGHKDMVELLIEYGADVKHAPAEPHGATALQFAVSKGYLGIAYVLLEHGAEVDAPGAPPHGWTALEHAAAEGRIDMVQLLLNAGAEIHHGAGKAQYERALQYAAYNGHLALKKLLEDYHG